VLRLALLASIIGSFLFGVVAGTVALSLLHRWPTYALVVPVSFLLWVIYVDWRKPIADVKELDLTADPDYGGYASIKSILPPELGLYRLTHHRKTTQHHAPDFQSWVERLPGHWRVVILAVSPLTSFDTDAVLDLAAAVQKLRSGRRDLVVCGVRPVQYKVLNKAGFVDALGVENFAPDLDFAIARGMNLVQELTAGRNGEAVAGAA
jgi:anti-anti-sigma regulatory factor